MEFKNRKPQNENRVLITPEEGTPFYAIVQREDNPESGNEGTPIEAGIFEEFNQKVEKSVQDSSEALANSTSAISAIENLSVSCTEVDSTANPQVEIKTNAENNHKDIHFILPASKQGKSYRNKGAWNNIELYVNNELYIDTVSFNGCTYYCKVTNTNQQPEDNTENEYWGLLATRGSNANVTIVDNLESDNASYALSARQGNIINGKINNVEANLTQVSGTLNQNITQVESELNNKILANTTNIAENSNAISSNTSAIAANNSSIKNLTNQISNIINKVYPVGSIYISMMPTSPAELFGGFWAALSPDNTLWAKQWTSSAASLMNEKPIPAGIPNITGHVSYNTHTYGCSGAFSKDGYTNTPGGSTYKNTNNVFYFDANSGASTKGIYGNSETVQPPAYKVYMWKRTS